MSEPIKVGDLVVVVHTCCPDHEALGVIRTVAEMDNHGSCHPRCGRVFVGLTAHLSGCFEYLGWIPVSWLQKIEPEANRVDEKRDEEITA